MTEQPPPNLDQVEHLEPILVHDAAITDAFQAGVSVGRQLERAFLWTEINRWIRLGAINEPDESAQRNGLIIAQNIIAQRCKART